MRYRPLGRTGLDVSELTIGTAAFSGDCEAEGALALALDRGINAIEIEAGGQAEAAIGDILKRERLGRDVHVFARIRPLVPLDLPSPHVTADQVYPGSQIRAQTEASLKRLGLERLGCQQLHAWSPEWLGEGDWLETLGRLREEGKIAAIGVSLFDHDLDSGLDAVGSGAFDCIQLMFNLFDRGAADALLPACQARGIGVIVRSPLYFGALSAAIFDSAPFPASDWRHAYFFGEHLGETRERVRELEREVALPDCALPDMALRFSLSHPAVSTVAVGMSRRRHVNANSEAVERGPVDAARLAGLGNYRWLC